MKLRSRFPHQRVDVGPFSSNHRPKTPSIPPTRPHCKFPTLIHSHSYSYSHSHTHPSLSPTANPNFVISHPSPSQKNSFLLSLSSPTPHHSLSPSLSPIRHGQSHPISPAQKRALRLGTPRYPPQRTSPYNGCSGRPLYRWRHQEIRRAR